MDITKILNWLGRAIRHGAKRLTKKATLLFLIVTIALIALFGKECLLLFLILLIL